MECCVNALVTSFKETILAECQGMIKRNETESKWSFKSNAGWTLHELHKNRFVCRYIKLLFLIDGGSFSYKNIIAHEQSHKKLPPLIHIFSSHFSNWCTLYFNLNEWIALISFERKYFVLFFLYFFLYLLALYWPTLVNAPYVFTLSLSTPDTNISSLFTPTTSLHLGKKWNISL